jgi:hypothetical protein
MSHDLDTKKDEISLAMCKEQWDVLRLNTRAEWQSFAQKCFELKDYYATDWQNRKSFNLKFDVVPAAVGFLRT